MPPRHCAAQNPARLTDGTAGRGRTAIGTGLGHLFGPDAALVGILALILVWVIGIQLELSQSLAEEIEKREAEEQRRIALEQALEDPLTKGLVTFQDGRIGISGNVLFELNSDQLQAEGEEVLESLIAPLQTYLAQHDELLMRSEER